MESTRLTREASGWSGDLYRIRASVTTADLVHALRRDRVFRPIFAARLCQSHHANGSKGRIAGKVLRRLHRWAVHQAGMDFPWEAQVGPGLAIVHGWGLVVSPDAVIGSNVTIFHGVTIGRKDEIDSNGDRTVGGSPTIEDGVWIGPHALILGDVTVGEGSRIGGASVVTKDVPPRSLVVGNPAKVVKEAVPPDTPNAWLPE